MTSQEKVDFLLKLTEAKISLPKFTTERGREASGKMVDMPKLTGSVTVSLFAESELMLFRKMMTEEIITIFPQLKPVEKQPELPFEEDKEANPQSTQE